MAGAAPGGGARGRGGAGAGSWAAVCFERPGAPPRAASRAARSRRSECCESNVGLVPSGRRGQFLKGQPAGSHSCVLRRPSLVSVPGRRKTEQAREGAGAPPSAPRTKEPACCRTAAGESGQAPNFGPAPRNCGSLGDSLWFAGFVGIDPGLPGWGRRR